MLRKLLTKILNVLPPEKVQQPEVPPPEPPKPVLSAKEQATLDGKPWINVTAFDLDSENIHTGAFELDWNDLWVAQLIRAGYKIKDTDTDNDIVERWFTDICRNIVLETFEQEAADPLKRELAALKEPRIPGSKNLGDGRREVS